MSYRYPRSFRRRRAYAGGRGAGGLGWLYASEGGWFGGGEGWVDSPGWLLPPPGDSIIEWRIEKRLAIGDTHRESTRASTDRCLVQGYSVQDTKHSYKLGLGLPRTSYSASESDYNTTPESRACCSAGICICLAISFDTTAGVTDARDGENWRRHFYWALHRELVGTTPERFQAEFGIFLAE